jgi:hypothetical protein
LNALACVCQTNIDCHGKGGRQTPSASLRQLGLLMNLAAISDCLRHDLFLAEASLGIPEIEITHSPDMGWPWRSAMASDGDQP